MKPSYEELEEQLNRSRRLCDAALANERVWETAMMQACGEDGPKSVADKFAELKSQCAALAAELQSVKAMNDCLSEELRGYESDGAFEGPKMHLLWWQCETPNLDAFLAEVRASGIDQWIASRDGRWNGTTAEAERFAAHLRKGVQS
ncbi:TPA: hypothetical protein ONC63_001435 [Enterobacter kobei]|nr:hypothetical protein [Enterobacter kobei]